MSPAQITFTGGLAAGLGAAAAGHLPVAIAALTVALLAGLASIKG